LSRMTLMALICSDPDGLNPPVFQFEASNIEQTSIESCFNLFMLTGEQRLGLSQMTDTNSSCPCCDAMPSIVRQILDSRTGETVRMFECKCGKHNWTSKCVRRTTGNCELPS
jgi:formate dehydrogenase maturation protein FdhE